MTAGIDHYRSEFCATQDRLPGTGVPWIERTRQAAIDGFTELGFPTTLNENWKYTNVRSIEKRAFISAGSVTTNLLPQDLSPFLFEGMASHRLVFVNGRYVPSLSQVDELPDNVMVGSLAEAITNNAEELEPELARYADARAHGFAALNTAFMGNGAYIRLGKDKVVPDPIHLLFVSTLEEEVVTHPRNLVVAEANSDAVLIESYVNTRDASYLTNALTEVSLHENSRLQHYKLQEESEKAFHVATLEVHQARNSRFISHSVSLGGLLTRNDINVTLDAEGAESTLNGLYLARGRQHVDFHTRIDHVKPHGTSHEYYKGVLDGRSRGVFNGRVYVHPDAQRTDAQQSNHNLLLSKDAEVDTKPQLEIYADDVKCSHGATVGALDEDMLFYLRTRGVPENAARGLLTYGFAHDMVERMALAAIRSRLEEVFFGRLPNTQQVKTLV